MAEKNKKELARVTKEALLARAQQASDDKLKYKEYESVELQGTLTLKRIPISRICQIMDMAEDDNSTESGLELNKQLIYECVPIFQDKELQDAYGCVEPYDIVTKVLNENMGEINRLSEEILKMYGMSDEVQKLKN